MPQSTPRQFTLDKTYAAIETAVKNRTLSSAESQIGHEQADLLGSPPGLYTHNLLFREINPNLSIWSHLSAQIFEAVKCDIFRKRD